MGDATTVVLDHHRVRLALHHLRGPLDAGAAGWPLLLLHGLGERTAPTVPDEAAAWPGDVWGLDLTGHGASSVPVGGGYTCEVLVADVDVALAHLGPATLLGRGLGAYVALLAAGARPGLVRGAVLADGPGLGGGAGPGAAPIVALPDDVGAGPPDPYALHELAGDVRNPAHAASFARAAGPLAVAVAVPAAGRPPWLVAVAAEVPGPDEAEGVAAALARLAASGTD